MITANPSALALDPRQVAGTRFSDLVRGPGYSIELLSGYYDCLKSKSPIEFEQRVLRDNKEFVFRTFLVPILNEQNEVTHIWGTAHNLTDFLDPQRELLKLADDALYRSRKCGRNASVLADGRV